MHALYQLYWALSFLLPVAVIYLFISNRRLHARLAALEHIAEQGAAADTGRPAAAQPDPTPDETDSPRDAPADSDAVEAQPPLAPSEAEHTPAEGQAADRLPAFIATVYSWIRENWFYAVSALSLTLAGLFAGQYAADLGYLQPAVRIALAVAFGLGLIGAGETIRRRFGDGTDVATAYLPSIFTGAGIVTLFGAVLSARVLYAMMDGGAALAGLVAVAAFAVALGWFYGPLLAAIGIVGATAAPFLVGAEPGNPFVIQAYFGAIALAGLTINALRRWRWMDGLALILPYGAAFAVFLGTGGDAAAAAFVLLSVALALVAAVFLGGSLSVRLDGPSYLIAILSPLEPGAGEGAPRKVCGKVRFLDGVWLAAALGILIAAPASAITVQIAVIGLVALFGAAALWSRRSPGVSDLALIAAVALFGLVEAGWRFLVRWSAQEHAGGLDAAAMPLLVIVAAGLAMSLIAMMRSGEESAAARAGDDHDGEAGKRRGIAAGWAVAAAVVAPGLVVFLELSAAPAALIGALAWASVAIAFAAVATLAAERAARVDGPDRLRSSLGALVAMSMIALALFILLSKAALSVALAVLVLGAAALDARFGLRPMTWFIQAGVAVLIYRAVADPGVFWAMEAGLADIFLAYGVPVGAFAAALVLVLGMQRPLARSVLEGGLLVIAGTGVSVLVIRLVEALTHGVDSLTHWSLGLIATVWLLAAAASLRNAAATARDAPSPSLRTRLPRLLRYGLGVMAFMVAGAALALSVTILNPILGWREYIVGVVGVSSLVPAYLVPGLLIIAIARRVPGIAGRLRVAGTAIGGLLCFLYVCLSVAQLWRGNALSRVPMGDGELWSYTVVLLLSGGGLLIAAIRAGSRRMRHVANGVLILAIAKVFLVDAPDLEGLVRAASFLVLGLALAGLAWINRRAGMRVQARI